MAKKNIIDNLVKSRGLLSTYEDSPEYKKKVANLDEIDKRIIEEGDRDSELLYSLDNGEGNGILDKANCPASANGGCYCDGSCKGTNPISVVVSGSDREALADFKKKWINSIENGKFIIEPGNSWSCANDSMPDISHVKKRTQFLLKGYYQIGDTKGDICYNVSRVSQFDGNVYFNEKVSWVTTHWKNIV